MPTFHPKVCDKILENMLHGKIPYLWFYWEPYHFSKDHNLDKDDVIEAMRFLIAYDYVKLDEHNSKDLLEWTFELTEHGFLIANHPDVFGFEKKHKQELWQKISGSPVNYIILILTVISTYIAVEQSCSSKSQAMKDSKTQDTTTQVILTKTVSVEQIENDTTEISKLDTTHKQTKNEK